MCANYLPIRPEHAHLLDLPQMTFDYQAEVYPSDRSPIIIAPEQQPEWRRAIFGLVPVWAEDLKTVQKLLMPGVKLQARNQVSDMRGNQASLHSFQLKYF